MYLLIASCRETLLLVAMACFGSSDASTSEDADIIFPHVRFGGTAKIESERFRFRKHLHEMNERFCIYSKSTCLIYLTLSDSTRLTPSILQSIALFVMNEDMD